MIMLTVDEVIELHEKITAATGGSPGIRDNGLLESAVLGCYQSFGGYDLYPTVEEKAARMANLSRSALVLQTAMSDMMKSLNG